MAKTLALTQFMADTGFLKNMTLDTTTATRFMVLPTLKVTGLMPWSSTMYEACGTECKARIVQL